MIQGIFDLLIASILGWMLLRTHKLSNMIIKTKANSVAGPSQAELDHVRRLEIAAGLREPDPEPTPQPVTVPGKVITCMCGHRLSMHRKRSGGGCTVAVGMGGCACEWGQEDIMRWHKGKM